MVFSLNRQDDRSIPSNHHGDVSLENFLKLTCDMGTPFQGPHSVGVNTCVFTQMATFLFCLQLQRGMKGVFASVSRVALFFFFLILYLYRHKISSACYHSMPVRTILPSMFIKHSTKVDILIHNIC